MLQWFIIFPEFAEFCKSSRKNEMENGSLKFQFLHPTKYTEKISPACSQPNKQTHNITFTKNTQNYALIKT